jgi:signal transduction histidine kinase
MRMAVGLIGESEERSVRHHARGVLERQIATLERLVADVFGGVQAQQGTLQLHLAPVDIVEVALTAVETFGIWPHRRTSTCTSPFRTRPCRPSSPTARGSIMWSNLLGNAARYTPIGGHISVDVVSEDDAIDIVVTDSGCGIPSHGLATIFQPFTRAGRTAGDGGLGLGLWLAREIAVLHGGSIEARSEGPGRGSTFR